MDLRHCGRSRNASWYAETSAGGWWVVGVGKFQVDNVPLWERRWVAGVTARAR